MKYHHVSNPGFLISILLAICLYNNNACEGAGVDSSTKSMVFAPEHHFSEDLHEYFNYLHKDYSQRYFLENKTYLEAAFFSLSNRFFCFGELEVNVGLGRQSGAILLDPREIDEGFGPMLEYRMPEYTVKCGLDHHCFHQIDRDEWNTLYWNKLFAGFGSANLRDGEFKEYLRRNPSLTWRQRLTWRLDYGYFVHELFGILDTNALSWGNAYIHEIATDCRWAPYIYRGYAAVASWHNKVRIDRAGRWLWTEEVRAEAMVIHGAYGLSVYYDWVFLDQSIPRENRDRLMEAGIRIFM
jgi:hypothetical protein